MTESDKPAVSAANEPSFISKYKKEILIVLIAILMILFIVMNSGDVMFSLIFWKFPIPLVILILLFFTIGLVSAWVYSYFHRKELRKKVRELESKLRKYEGR